MPEVELHTLVPGGVYGIQSLYRVNGEYMKGSGTFVALTQVGRIQGGIFRNVSGTLNPYGGENPDGTKTFYSVTWKFFKNDLQPNQGGGKRRRASRKSRKSRRSRRN